MSPLVKHKKVKTIPAGTWLALLTFLCVAMMGVTYFTDLFDGPLRSAAGYLTVPFQKAIAQAGGYLYDRSVEMVQIRKVLEENEELKARIDELTLENSQLQQDKYELTSLRELYEIDQVLSSYEKVGARIIASDSGNWFYSFIVNKGSADGIEKDMNVIAGGGLVGRVSFVSDHYARVTSIIADDSSVYATVLSTSENLVINGNLESLMTSGTVDFEQLSDKADKVNTGDKVVTSTLSSIYLPGIPVGYITEIGVSENNLTKSGKITPQVDFEHLREVLIIKEMKFVPEEQDK